MKLIKIFSDRVHIKTDSEQLKDLKINDLLLLSDKNTSIVCVVTGITGNESMNIYDYDGEALGQTEENNTIECGIMGSLVNDIFTKAIDIYPTTKVDIALVTKEMFIKMLSGGSGDNFKLGEYSSYGTESLIDGNRFFQRHSAIVGNTGSGKSFAVASILEKLAELKSSNVILFDLHGEYTGMSYAKAIKIGNGGMDFPIWFLPFRDIYGSLLKMKDESAILQLAALRKAFYKARFSNKSEDTPIAFDTIDIFDALKEENEDVVHTGEIYKTGDKAGSAKTVKGENNGKLASVISLLEDKLNDKRYAFMFNQQTQDYLYDFINSVYGNREKGVKVIDLSDVPHDMIPTVVAVMTKLIYNVHLQHDKTKISPVTFMCDEAHVYIPSSDFGLGASQRRLLEIFETIAKEGRKFGVTLCIVSQRPAELNKTIMAQCANFIVMKMTNETDKSMIKNILPESSQSIIDMLSLFMPGDCLVIGDSVKITFKAKISLPTEQPLSNTINVWDTWQCENSMDVPALVDNLLNDNYGMRRI